MLRAFTVAVAAAAALMVGCGATRGSEASREGDGGAGGQPGGGGAGAAPKGAEAGLVVDAPWLSEHLADPSVQVVDARTEYPGGHIPGAIALLSESLVDRASPFPGAIAPPADAADALRRAGLRNGTTVVVYGDPPEYEPARVIWALHHYLHGDVRYLDGGFARWVEGGGAVAPGAPPGVAATDYTVVGLDPSLVVSGEWLRAQLGAPPYTDVPVQLVDARGPDEVAAGHIPSALHVDWTRHLDGGRLVAGASGAYASLDPGVTTVAYCLVGWRASVTWLALRELGFQDVRVYDGSWAEWGRGGFPVE